MSYYRDTATALAQLAPEDFIGVVLYVPLGGESTAPFWSMSHLNGSAALEEWYEDIAPSHGLYYYLAAFDKTRGSWRSTPTPPVGESIAPPKPGQPGFDLHYTDRWRHSPFRKPTTPTVSGHRRGHYGGSWKVVGADAPPDPGAAVPVIIMVGFTALLIATLRDEARLNRGR